MLIRLNSPRLFLSFTVYICKNETAMLFECLLTDMIGLSIPWTLWLLFIIYLVEFFEICTREMSRVTAPPTRNHRPPSIESYLFYSISFARWKTTLEYAAIKWITMNCRYMHDVEIRPYVERVEEQLIKDRHNFQICQPNKDDGQEYSSL